MGNLIYLEPEEEISDLVERIRDVGGEADLVFVVPDRSRVLQTELNVRLLQQYARSFIKSAAIVTRDPRTQQLAADHGVPVYASMAAYEHGVEAVPEAQAVGAAVAAAGIGGAVGAGISEGAAAFHRDAMPAAAPASPTATVAKPPPPPRLRPGGRAGDHRPGIYVAAAAAFLVGLLLLILVAPTAKVTVVLQATPVKEDNLTVQGTPTVGQVAGHVVTAAATATASGQFDFRATGTRPVAAAPAQSAVQFTTDFSAPFCLQIAKGTILAESPGLSWASSVAPAGDPQCAPFGGGVYVPASSTGQFAGPSKPLSVTASTAGSAGNVGAGTINQVDPAINGCKGGPSPPCSPSDFAVTNPAPAAGGVDAKTLTVVSPGDAAAYLASLDAMTKTLTAQVKQSMLAQNPGKVFAIDPGGNGLLINTTATPATPLAGAQAPGDQQVRVDVIGNAALYNPADVKAVMDDKLRADVQLVQADAILDDHSKVIKDPVVQQAGPDAIVVFSISGSGYATPAVDTARLKDGFTGKTKSAVRKLVTDQYGAAVKDVQISQSLPFFVLPFFSSRIDVSVCVRSPNQAC